jgi:hypothetical protein
MGSILDCPIRVGPRCIRFVIISTAMRQDRISSWLLVALLLASERNGCCVTLTNTEPRGTTSPPAEGVIPPLFSPECVDAIYFDDSQKLAGVPLQYFVDAVEATNPSSRRRTNRWLTWPFSESRASRAFETAVRDTAPLAQLPEHPVVTARYKGDERCTLDANFMRATPRTELRYSDRLTTFRWRPTGNVANAPKSIPYVRWQYEPAKELVNALKALTIGSLEAIHKWKLLELFFPKIDVQLTWGGKMVSNDHCSLEFWINAEGEGLNRASTLKSTMVVTAEFSKENAALPLEDRFPHNIESGQPPLNTRPKLGTHYSVTTEHGNPVCSADQPCEIWWTLEGDALRHSGVRGFHGEVRDLVPVTGALPITLSTKLQFSYRGSQPISSKNATCN